MLGKIKGKEEAVASPSQGQEFEQALGDGEGQGSLACCSPWGLKGSDMTEPLNNNQLSGHESEQILGDSGGQGSLACYSP